MEIKVQSHFQNKNKNLFFWWHAWLKGLCKIQCSTFPMTRKKTSSQFLVCRWSKDFVFQQEFKSSGSFLQQLLDFLFWFSQQHRLCNCKSNCVHLSNGVHRSKHFHIGIQTLQADWYTDLSWRQGRNTKFLSKINVKQILYLEQQSKQAVLRTKNILKTH